MQTKNVEHKTVMIKEVISALNLKDNSHFLDATIGAGGHTKAILEKYPNIKTMGIDKDEHALSIAKKNLSKFKNSISLRNLDFSSMEQIVKMDNFNKINGILFDLGTSQIQLNDNKRGFSFRYNAPLDMRMDQKQKNTAHEIVNKTSEFELNNILREFGEEKHSKKITKAIIRKRPINNTEDLTNTILSVYPRSKKRHKIHPATKSFQAIRIAVNSEIELLKIALSKSLQLLEKPGGRLVVISFHSLEDRIVKHFFQHESKSCICPTKLIICNCNHVAKLQIINKKIITPTNKEIDENPSARSAKMRIAETIDSRRIS
jgi:16S rRNA (cytosine1402-N4)-methyltransferase